jgi:hypothetical protein
MEAKEEKQLKRVQARTLAELISGMSSWKLFEFWQFLLSRQAKEPVWEQEEEVEVNE